MKWGGGWWDLGGTSWYPGMENSLGLSEQPSTLRKVATYDSSDVILAFINSDEEDAIMLMRGKMPHAQNEP